MPPAVSKRNHFESVGLLVEDAFRNLPEEYRSPKLEQWLRWFAERLVRSVADNFATAAESGIQQAANLICDPDYYATLRERRRRHIERMKTDRARQEQEYQERRQCPTPQQIEQEIARLEQWIPEGEARLQSMKARLEQLRAMKPRHFRITDLQRRKNQNEPRNDGA
jgi:hypothetical protein